MRIILAILTIFTFNSTFASFFDGDPKDSILTINTTSNVTLIISRKNKECIKCPFTYPIFVKIDQNQTVTINTDYPSYFFKIENSDTKMKYCSDLESSYQTFGESAKYLLEIRQHMNSTELKCNFRVLKDPTNRYTPIIAAVFIYIGAAALYIAGRYVYRSMFSDCFEKTEENAVSLTANSEVSINEAPVAKTVKKSNRLESVDTLRGICLCIMIFVNYGAGDYAFLDHAVWNGLHLADLVFPCFVYIMGVSIALSLFAITSKAKTAENRSNLNVKQLIFKCVKRTCLLFLFGLLVSNGTELLSKLRIMGVLQRFAVSYFVCAMLEIIHLHFRGYIYEVQESFEQVSWQSNFKEIFYYKLQWVFIMVLTLVWLLLTFLLPVPGCPTGYIGPGGLHENASHINCTGGAAGYIDRVILGYFHIYSSPTCKSIYETQIPYDPEGLLGCLTSCILTYIGMSAGHIFIHYKQPSRRVFRFVTYGVIYGSITLILCKASRDDGWIPINKNLWSLTFILALASISFLALSFLYLFIDVWNWFSGAPFIFPGKNSICIYICHEIFSDRFPVRISTPETHGPRLAMDLYGVTLWCIVSAVLYYKKIFINL